MTYVVLATIVAFLTKHRLPQSRTKACLIPIYIVKYIANAVGIIAALQTLLPLTGL